MREDQVEQLRTENEHLRETLAILETAATRHADAYDFAPAALCMVDEDAVVREVNLTAATILGRHRDDLVGEPLATLLAVQPGELRLHFQRCRASGRRTITRLSQNVRGDDRTLELSSVAVGDAFFSTEFSDVSERKREFHVLNFLGAASHQLTALLSPEDVSKAAASLALALGSFAAIDILGEGGRWHPGAQACGDAGRAQRLAEIGLGFMLLPRVREAALVAQSSGQTQVIEDLGQELGHPLMPPGRAELVTRLDLGSCMVVPLVSGYKTIAMLTLAQSRADRPYGTSEVALAIELGRRIAAAMERSLLHREVVRASLAKDRFLAIVSHELRTPIAALIMWIRALRETEDGATRAKALDAIEEAAKLQSRLVGDLIDLARGLAGKLSVSLGPVDLERAIVFAIETQRSAAAQRQLSIEMVTRHRCGEVWADSTRVVQIVTNLLSNAIKFSSEGGRIVVSLDVDEEDAVVTVKDEGHGIAPELMPVLFDPFQQGDDVPRQKSAGLGLGLAIVKQLAELHGGSVQAESKGRDQGAELTVRLPLLHHLDSADAPSFLATLRKTQASRDGAAEGPPQAKAAGPESPRSPGSPGAPGTAGSPGAPGTPGSPGSPGSDDETATGGKTNELGR